MADVADGNGGGTSLQMNGFGRVVFVPRNLAAAGVPVLPAAFGKQVFVWDGRPVGIYLREQSNIRLVCGKAS